MQKHQRRRVVRLRADHAVFKPLSRDIEKTFVRKRSHGRVHCQFRPSIRPISRGLSMEAETPQGATNRNG